MTATCSGRRDEAVDRAKMKNVLAILWILVCACSVSGDAADRLYVRAALTIGERSKDSSSQTTTITVSRNAILWERSFGGRGGETPPLRKEFKLSPADKAHLVKLIEANDLLVTDSIELPQASSNYRYFKISADLTLDGKKGAIKISGLRNAVDVREERLYQHILTLVKELYRIMNSQNKSVRFEELILESTTR